MATEMNAKNLQAVQAKVDLVEFPPPVAVKNGATILAHNHDVLKDVQVKLEVCLGQAAMSLAQLFDLKDGSVVEMSRTVDDPVDLVLNGKVIARGQLVASGDQFGVRITEIKAADASA